MKRFFLVLGLAFSAAAQPALADDPCAVISNLVSRPTITNSACTVALSHVLFETGYQNLSASNGGNSVTYPQALIRVGTAIPHVELQFMPPQAVRTNGQSGVGDIGAGVKYLFRDTVRYQAGAQLNLTAPSGTRFASAGASQTTFALNGSYALSPAFSLASTQAFESLAAGGLRYGAYASTLALMAALPHASQLFGEYALQTHANGPVTGSRTQFMLGITHAIGSRLQLDAEGISSPTTSTGRYTGLGFGASLLI